MWPKALARVPAAAGFMLLAVSVGHAQTPAEFYKGRVVDLYIGYSVGGGYDLYARVLARHIGNHIPGRPTVVAKNMQGAGSLRLANWLFQIAPKDGSTFGIIGRGTAFDPVLGAPGAHFDGTKFTWIGSANDEVSLCVAWRSSGIGSFQDLLTKQLTVGATGMSDDTYQFPSVINGVLGAKMRIVNGYPGGNDVVLAMERGEVQGRCGWSWTTVKATHKAWLEEKKMNILVQLSLAKHPDLPGIPLITDFAKSDEQQQILKLIFARQMMGRPFVAPPGIPADRTEALRKAFMETMRDKDFLADAEKAQIEITPVPGKTVEALVEEVYRTPTAVAKKAASMLK